MFVTYNNIHFNIILQSVHKRCIFLTLSKTQFHMHFLFPTACNISLIFLQLITLTILRLQCELCNFLHSPLTSSFLGPNIFLSILFPDILGLCSYFRSGEKNLVWIGYTLDFHIGHGVTKYSEVNGNNHLAICDYHPKVRCIFLYSEYQTRWPCNVTQCANTEP
jgi:hypothetical protein